MDHTPDRDPHARILKPDLGRLHNFAHEYDQALERCNRARTMDNSFIAAHVYLRDIYQMKGMDQEFFEELSRTTTPHTAKAQRIFAGTGRKGVLLLEVNDPNRPMGHMAWLSASLRDREKTLVYLNRVLQERGTGAFFLPFINVDPLYDFLRDDSRFKEILHRMNLP